MSLKILFNRESLVVRSLEAVGVFLSLLYFWKNGAHLGLTSILYLFLFLSYLFVRACDSIDWYRRKDLNPADPRQVGIRVQFRKAIVPSSYILAVTSVLAVLGIPYLSLGVLVLAVLMMLVVAPVNGILIYFHLKDNDPLPINFFSSNRYVHEAPAGPEDCLSTPSDITASRREALDRREAVIR